ncbi:MAG: radical SAM protein [Bacteroidetes bacterium]|nr:MAG: radical SAM protein [Bacteroidota bacterium]
MSSGKKRLLLINPVNRTRRGFSNDDSTSFMPIGLGIVAALTPNDWEIELIDESFEDFSYRPADLVGLTSFTANAPRAYEIAGVYRTKGIPTVIGGIHASMIPEEAVKYVDAVVVGEAETSWPQLLKDFGDGKLKSVYNGGIADIRTIPHVRRDIFKYPYVYDLIQTSRGCPMGCDFCSVTQMCGKSYREREVDEILDELEKTTRPLIFFVDDHLVNNTKGAQKRAIQLFRGMVERGIKRMWFSQASINFADNEEVLYWAGKSGCKLILMGIEADTQEALADAKKRLNLKRGVDSFALVFRKMNKYGIGVLGTLIFGFESDTREALYKRRDYILRSGIDAVQSSLLTPLPGTTLFARMKEQGRIGYDNFPDDWKHFHFMHPTLGTAHMDTAEIEAVMKEIWLSLYNKENIRRMMFRTLWRTKSLKAAYWAYASNHNYGRIALEEVIRTHPDGVDANMEWKNKPRSLYLRFTDYVIMLIYTVSWGKMLRKIAREVNKHVTE